MLPSSGCSLHLCEPFVGLIADTGGLVPINLADTVLLHQRVLDHAVEVSEPVVLFKDDVFAGVGLQLRGLLVLLRMGVEQHHVLGVDEGLDTLRQGPLDNVSHVGTDSLRAPLRRRPHAAFVVPHRQDTVLGKFAAMLATGVLQLGLDDRQDLPVGHGLPLALVLKHAPGAGGGGVTSDQFGRTFLGPVIVRIWVVVKFSGHALKPHVMASFSGGGAPATG